MAQLVERLHPTPEICSSYPAIGKFALYQLLKSCVEITKAKKKEAGNCNFFKTGLVVREEN